MNATADALLSGQPECSEQQTGAQAEAASALDQKEAAKAARKAEQAAKKAAKAAKKAAKKGGQGTLDMLYQASVDELTGGLAPVNKEALLQMFNLLTEKHSRFLNRLQMSAIFRAFNDKDSQKHELIEMSLGEWEGLCRVYSQVPTEGYGIPLSTLGEVYKLHLVKTNTAPNALEFLRKESEC